MAAIMRVLEADIDIKLREQLLVAVEGTAISLQRAQHRRHDQQERDWSLCLRCSEKYLTLTLILSGFDG